MPNLSAVYLPDAVTEMGSYFLRECQNITQINLQNTGLQTVGLVAVYLPDSVSAVGNHFLRHGKCIEQVDLRTQDW